MIPWTKFPFRRDESDDLMIAWNNHQKGGSRYYRRNAGDALILDIGKCQSQLVFEEVERQCKHAIVLLEEEIPDEVMKSLGNAFLFYRKRVRTHSKYPYDQPAEVQTTHAWFAFPLAMLAIILEESTPLPETDVYRDYNNNAKCLPFLYKHAMTRGQDADPVPVGPEFFEQTRLVVDGEIKSLHAGCTGCVNEMRSACRACTFLHIECDVLASPLLTGTTDAEAQADWLEEHPMSSAALSREVFRPYKHAFEMWPYHTVGIFEVSSDLKRMKADAQLRSEAAQAGVATQRMREHVCKSCIKRDFADYHRCDRDGGRNCGHGPYTKDDLQDYANKCEPWMMHVAMTDHLVDATELVPDWKDCRIRDAIVGVPIYGDPLIPGEHRAVKITRDVRRKQWDHSTQVPYADLCKAMGVKPVKSWRDPRVKGMAKNTQIRAMLWTVAHKSSFRTYRYGFCQSDVEAIDIDVWDTNLRMTYRTGGQEDFSNLLYLASTRSTWSCFHPKDGFKIAQEVRSEREVFRKAVTEHKLAMSYPQFQELAARLVKEEGKPVCIDMVKPFIV